MTAKPEAWEKRAWTADEETHLRYLYERRRSLEDIASILGRTYHSIRLKAERLGLDYDQSKSSTSGDLNTINKAMRKASTLYAHAYEREAKAVARRARIKENTND